MYEHIGKSTKIYHVAQQLQQTNLHLQGGRGQGPTQASPHLYQGMGRSRPRKCTCMDVIKNNPKVIKMIDEMVATLKTEQTDDDHKKEYCAAQFDQADDKKKGLERAKSDLETAIADAKDGIATLKDEIEALGKSIKALDKAVAESSEQRKEENEDFTELMASDSAAKEILAFAKNRLNKFYTGPHANSVRCSTSVVRCSLFCLTQVVLAVSNSQISV